SVGGGIRNCGSLTISGGQINHNYAYIGGGGLYTGGGSPSVTIDNCLVGKEASSAATGLSDCGNYSAGEGGGGIYFAGGTLTTTSGFTVSKNYSATYGGGLYVDNDLTLSTGTISYNGAANGGGLNLASSGSFTLSGGTVSANAASSNGGAAYINGTFTMSAGASIPGGTGGANDVYLCAGKTIAVGETLTAASPVATISHENFVTGTSVLSGTSITATICAKFAAKGGDFTIVPDGAGTAGVLALGTIYVDGTNGFDTNSGTSAYPLKTLHKAFQSIAGANCTIIVVNGTTEEQALTIPATATGLTIQTNDGSQKDIIGGLVGTNLVAINIDASGTTIKNLAFNTFAGINVRSSVTGVHLENVKIKDNHNDIAGGGLYLGGDAVVTATDLNLENCYLTDRGSGGGIYIYSGASLTVDGLTMTDCRVLGDNSDGGGIYNWGTLNIKDSVISGCTTTGSGAGIYSANDAVTILDGSANIANEIYLYDGEKPLLVTSDFALASGASVIPLKANIATGYYQFGDAALKGYGTYALEESKLSCFGMANTGVALVYDSSGTAPVGKLKDVTVTGGVSVSFSGNVSFVMTAPSAASKTASFIVKDSSSGSALTVTPTSSRIEIRQYGGALYSADSQSVRATYFPAGAYELYCRALYNGNVYDTTSAFTVTEATITMKTGSDINSELTGATINADATSCKFKPCTLFLTDEQLAAKSKVTLSQDTSEIPCYAWLESGVVYYYADGWTNSNVLIPLDADSASMLKNCKFTEIDMSGFSSQSVTTMSSMFDSCSSLTTVDISTLSSESLTTMSGMFSGCSALTALEFPTAFTAQNVTSMQNAFKSCAALSSLNLENLAPAAIANMSYMFNSCSNLASLTLGNFTLASGCSIDYMFGVCSKLVTITVPDGTDWSSTAASSTAVFGLCSHLVGGAGTTYSSSNIGSTYARVDRGTGEPGYFTSVDGSTAIAP
nr:DUF285 domain-containing protein [Clostridiales bacterium]